MNFLKAAHEFLCQAIITSLTACAFIFIAFIIAFCVVWFVISVKDCGGLRNFIMGKFPENETEESEWQRTD